jgi:NAD(P)-dependent dehydrogenase (short-subunit alcohol dehydrogenase family)
MNQPISNQWCQGRVALVTGASSGMGRETALALGRAGAKVGVNYCRNQATADATVQEIKSASGEAITIQADVSQSADVDRMFAELACAFGDRLDYLVNNAGEWMKQRTLVVDCSDELIERMWSINARSVFFCCRAAARRMIQQGDGVIVNVGSNVGHSGGGGGTVPYCAAKAAVNTLTRGLGRELGPHGIRVVGVAPGVVDTPMTEHLAPEIRQKVMDATPLRRFGEANEVAGTILALLSPSCSFVSGTILDVDGGYLTR